MALAHQLQARSIRIEFDVSVSDNALSTDRYSLIAVTPGTSSQPSIQSASFYDSSRRSIVLSLDGGLTDTETYSLEVSGVLATDGSSLTTSSHNFVATVADFPVVLGAYLSRNNRLSVVFDRPVGEFSAAATGTITPEGGSDFALTLIPWDEDVMAASVIEFELNASMTNGNSFSVHYEDVCDSSLNLSTGDVSLSIPERLSKPVSYATLSSIQVSDGWIDAYVPAFGEAYACVTYTCPAYASDVTDVSKYTASILSSHVAGDTVNDETNTATDLATLITLVNSFKGKFNSHLANERVHLSPAPYQASMSDLLRVVNDLRKVFNIHIRNTTVHEASDLSSVVSTPAASDLATCITLLIDLNTKYNAHRVSSGVHATDDTEYAVASASPTDLHSAAVFADDLRTSMQMHFGLPWHSEVDPSISPVDYCLPQVILSNAADVYGATALVMESQYKYEAHRTARSHVHPDYYNVSAIEVVEADDTPAAISSMNALVDRYQDHIADEYSLTVESVFDNQSEDSNSMEGGPHTFQSQIGIAVPTVPGTEVMFTADIRSDDQSSSTDPGLESGALQLRSLTAEPKLLDARQSSTTLSLTFDKELSLPRTQDVSITTSGGIPVRVQSISLSSSLPALTTFARCLATAFNNHLSGAYSADHRTADTVNVIDSPDFPGSTLEQTIVCLNAVRTSFNSHVTNLTFHEGYPASAAIKSPEATDRESAITLAAELSLSLRQHNLDGAHHSSVGRDLVLWKLFDTVVITHDEVKNGTVCTVRTSLIRRLRKETGDEVLPFSLSIITTSVSSNPRLSAAVPRLGLTTVHSTPAIGKDRIDLFFSKPMLSQPFDPSDFSVSPSVTLGDSRWSGDSVASVDVRGMVPLTQYSMAVSGASDKSGNPIE